MKVKYLIANEDEKAKSVDNFMTVFSARCNIYISRLCYDASVRLSVRLSVTFVHCGHSAKNRLSGRYTKLLTIVSVSLRLHIAIQSVARIILIGNLYFTTKW